MQCIFNVLLLVKCHIISVIADGLKWHVPILLLKRCFNDAFQNYIKRLSKFWIRLQRIVCRSIHRQRCRFDTCWAIKQIGKYKWINDS